MIVTIGRDYVEVTLIKEVEVEGIDGLLEEPVHSLDVLCTTWRREGKREATR